MSVAEDFTFSQNQDRQNILNLIVVLEEKRAQIIKTLETTLNKIQEKGIRLDLKSFLI